MATVAVRYGGDTVTANETGIHIQCDDADTNTDTGYDTNNYPASPAILYYFTAELTGQDDLVSQVFSPNGGHGYWDGGLVLPAAGTWTIHLRLSEDDSSVANTTVEAV
jgi:hypothetical protein